MLVSEKFVFTPALLPDGMGGLLPVNRLIASVSGGKPADAGVAGPAGLAALGKPVLALVCDPRSWYLTLWRQGCEGMGSLFHHMGDDRKWAALRKRAGALPTALAPGGIAASMAAELPAHWGADHAIDTWYANPNDVAAFREWLRAVLAVRALRGLISADYARSPLSRSCGFMSFQYSQQFIHNPNELGVPATDARSLRALDKAKGLVTQSVRIERLASDLPPALEALGLPLTESQVAMVEKVRDDLPPLRRDWSRFYGLDELALISERERFICARLSFSMEPARAQLIAQAQGTAAPSQGAADRPARRPAAAKKAAAKKAAAKRTAGAEAPSSAAVPDAAEIERQARIANIRRLQQERLAQRRASGKLAAPRPPAPRPPGDDNDSLPLLQDFEED